MLKNVKTKRSNEFQQLFTAFHRSSLSPTMQSTSLVILPNELLHKIIGLLEVSELHPFDLSLTSNTTDTRSASAERCFQGTESTC